MMDTRDRLVEVGANIDANKGEFIADGKQLLGDYITNEELVGLYKLQCLCRSLSNKYRPLINHS